MEIVVIDVNTSLIKLIKGEIEVVNLVLSLLFVIGTLHSSVRLFTDKVGKIIFTDIVDKVTGSSVLTDMHHL